MSGKDLRTYLCADGKAITVYKTAESKEEWAGRRHGYFWLYEGPGRQRRTKKGWLAWGQQNNYYVHFAEAVPR